MKFRMIKRMVVCCALCMSWVSANVITMTFEEFLGNDGAKIGTFYPGVHFEALSDDKEDWMVSDVTTDLYNASSWADGTSFDIDFVDPTGILPPIRLPIMFM